MINMNRLRQTTTNGRFRPTLQIETIGKSSFIPNLECPSKVIYGEVLECLKYLSYLRSSHLYVIYISDPRV